jgi:hypothetical protein
MKRQIALILITVTVFAIFSPIAYWHCIYSGNFETPLFFDSSFGGKTADEAKHLIDKVKGYTNFFLITSWDLIGNETALTEVCDYAAESDLDFIVFLSWVSNPLYPWHLAWLDKAEARWGDNFLGIYLFDEPGGTQVDTGGEHEAIAAMFKNASDYGDAADIFVDNISSINSTLELKRRNISIFTSDYALYWFDYLAGYDTVFVELAWNQSRPQQIGLCRGAANAQGKEWGAIITWTYDQPPYLASGQEIFADMLAAYEAGAKYVIIFNYPVYPEGNLYGLLHEDHFAAMQQFWERIHRYPEDYGKLKGRAALVLPKDYGWGMRRPDDSIWGLWPADDVSPVIWDKMNNLIELFGLELDIVYDDPLFNLTGYPEIYYWES